MLDAVAGKDLLQDREDVVALDTVLARDGLSRAVCWREQVRHAGWVVFWACELSTLATSFMALCVSILFIRNLASCIQLFPSCRTN